MACSLLCSKSYISSKRLRYSTQNKNDRVTVKEGIVEIRSSSLAVKEGIQAGRCHVPCSLLIVGLSGVGEGTSCAFWCLECLGLRILPNLYSNDSRFFHSEYHLPIVN